MDIFAWIRTFLKPPHYFLTFFSRKVDPIQEKQGELDSAIIITFDYLKIDYHVRKKYFIGTNVSPSKMMKTTFYDEKCF